MSTRRVTLEDKMELQFDHGVSYFTCSSPHFRDILDEWVEAGVVAPWECRMGMMDHEGQKDGSGAVTIVDKAAPVGRTRYVGHPKMSSIGTHIASSSGVKVRAGTRVTAAQLTAEDTGAPGGATWSLTTRPSNKPTQPCVVEGPFSAVVVADRQVASNSNVFMYGEVAPIESIPDISSMADVLQSVGDVSVFVLIVAFQHPLAVVHDGIVVDNHNVVSSFYRDSSKPGRPAASGDQWVMHAGLNASKEYISSIPASCAVGSEDYEKHLVAVTDKMYEAFQEVLLELSPLGTPLPPLIYKKAHRWKAAFPSQSVAPVDGCLVDHSKHLVACGDFCFEPSERPSGFVEAATLSGRAAAIKVAEICTRAQVLEPKL